MTIDELIAEGKKRQVTNIKTLESWGQILDSYASIRNGNRTFHGRRRINN
jgi:hypothetical protein